MDRSAIIDGVLLVGLGTGAAAMTQLGPTMFPEHSALIFWACTAIAVLCFALLAVRLSWKPNRRTDVTEEVGDENVLLGINLPKNVGSRNVIASATDSNGNTYLNRPASIGYAAGYAPDSTIIGAYAGHNLGSVQPPKKTGDDEVPHRDNDEEK